MQPFKIDVPDSVLEDLKQRLAMIRYPDELDADAWSYGTDLQTLKELCHYWTNTYDWRKHEAYLNSFDHFKTDIDGLDIHYIHARSKEPDAFPLIITHGWPGSIYEFHKIIGPLTDPVAHGGKAEDAYHVICPSMPGYGFSEKPNVPGFDLKKIASINIKLMEKLGYSRYGAQGGDWGSLVTSWMGILAPEKLCGIHLNMLVAAAPKDRDPMEGVTAKEAETLAQLAERGDEEVGYQKIQGTKPQTLGYGLNDSPMGLAAWILEKFHGWSDCHGDVESRFSKDELLTNIMIYWVTQTITSSMRLYCENMRSGLFSPVHSYVKIPCGFAVFPVEIASLPRRWIEDYYNVTHWTEMPSGGHFAALEEPVTLVNDIRAFFSDKRA